MKDIKRRRRAFQPAVDSMEGRVVLSTGGAVAAHAAGMHQLQVQEARHLGNEHRIEARAVKQHGPRNHEAVMSASTTNPGAMSIVMGTPSQTMPQETSPGPTASSGGLQIHALAPNNLDAVNNAIQGGSVGVMTTGTTVSTGRTVSIGTASSPNLGSVMSAGTIPSTMPTSSSMSSMSATMPVFNVPTTPSTSATSPTGMSVTISPMTATM